MRIIVIKKTLYFYKENNEYKVVGNYSEIQDKSSIVNKYECQTSNCTPEIATQQFYYKSMQDGNCMIYEMGSKNTYYVFFNVDKGILGTYSNPVWLNSSMNKDTSNGEYIYLKDFKSSKYGVIDKNGNIIKKFTLDGPAPHNGIGFPSPAEVYSIKNNLLVASKNGKYGVSKLTSEDVIIDYKYDSIKLIDDFDYDTKTEINNKYFIAKSNNKWYLYSFETKLKEFSEGYDDIVNINTTNILLARIDNYWYIKDYKGNNLIDEKIEDLENPCYESNNNRGRCVDGHGIGIILNGEIVTINTYSDVDDNIYEVNNSYEYDILNNKLTKKIEE